MFNSIAEIVEQAESRNKKIYELMIEAELEYSEKSEADIIAKMTKAFNVMKNAVNEGIEGVVSHSGMTGFDAKRLYTYIQKGQYLTDETVLKAMCYAVATNEVNASMGIICATPTAGSSGVLPGAIIALQQKYDFPDELIIKHLFTAGAIGYVIANNASISGAAGGCQAEVGSASGMAAAAITELVGGTPRQAANAMAIALKNMMGLTCDPLAGLVEVPCIKRNAAGASNAIIAAEMSLAGVDTKVPWDEVISAMYKTGLAMPSMFRETALGGLAATPTGMAWKQKLWIQND